MDVKRDIVHTIRQAVDVVSKYAGGALPEPARTRVRGFILTLPQRWASKAGGTGAGAISTAGNSERDSTVTAAASGSGATRRPGGQRRAAYRERGSGGIESNLRSGASSRATSPSMSPRIPRTAVSRRGGGDVGEGGENARVSAGTALVAAQRILALATESLDMMRNVTGVMKDSLDRAEAYVFFSSTFFFIYWSFYISRWVGRLRTVGIQRDTQEEETTDTSEFQFLQRTNQQQQHHHHRDRSGSSSTQFDEADQDNMPSSPFFSASSTVWGSNSIPSTPARGTFTPVYAGGGKGGGTASPGMTIPIGAMSLSSRYETPRSSVLNLADEEEEEGEEGDGMVTSKQEGSGQVRDNIGDEEGEGGLKMDVDVDVRGWTRTLGVYTDILLDLRCINIFICSKIRNR
jgi:transcriptional repressor OPI1